MNYFVFFIVLIIYCYILLIDIIQSIKYISIYWEYRLFGCEMLVDDFVLGNDLE